MQRSAYDEAREWSRRFGWPGGRGFPPKHGTDPLICGACRTYRLLGQEQEHPHPLYVDPRGDPEGYVFSDSPP
jgi:hypothetical protein